MPAMTGLELAKRLKSAGFSVPIVLMTGTMSNDITARAAGLGITKVLQKPTDGDEVLVVVEAVLASR